MVAYSFAEVAGYQKIGSYTGNGSTTGPTVTTGFRPRFIMAKDTTDAGAWYVWDSARQPNNPNNERLLWNTSDAEATLSGVNIDFNDNGFQLKTSDGALNGSGNTYIYLAIADTTDAQFNFDASGNKNNWTPNNINSNASGESSYDLMSDVPTLTDTDTANFTTMNPLYSSISGSYPTPTLTEGNLAVSTNSGSNWKHVPSTMYVSSGKYYAEVKVTYTDLPDCFIGFVNSGYNGQSHTPSETSFGYEFHNTLGIRHNGTQLSTGTFTQNDVIGLALNMDDNELSFYKNGSLVYTATSVANANWGISTTSIYTKTLYCNFGQRPFAYTPPTGFKKLNTFNLPDSTITDGSEHFDTVLFTGDGSNDRFISTGFSTDFTWLKNRGTTNSHYLSDTVRGNEKGLNSNGTAAEFNYSSYGGLSFATGGITVDTGTSNVFNTSGGSFVTWNWRGSDSTAASNSAGSITSTVSANPTAGFSVVTWTGNNTVATVGHGLGVAPKLVIVKNRNYAVNWNVWATGFSGDEYLLLNTTAAKASYTNNWGSTPTTNVFGVGNNNGTNGNTNGMVAYCFAEIEGYSKISSYIGNGSTDGPFVYTGFRPAFLILKQTNTTRDWQIHDTARNPYNVSQYHLKANDAGAEGSGSGAYLDIVSNGFKLKTSGAGHNNSGGTYIYMAFAENPFKNSNAR